MKRLLNIIDVYKKWLILPLLCIVGWQQWTTFSKYETKFSDPVNFIKTAYGTDYITQYSNRYNEVKKIFSSPVNATYIGESPEEKDYLSGAVMHYYLTQYNLAPSIIFNDEEPQDTIVCNLYNSIHINQQADYYLNNGYHVVKDFNNGLIVIAK